MEQEVCPNCGANEISWKETYGFCPYCNSKFKRKKASHISLRSDIDILLEKCEKEPWNAKKYANLILDIDPTNQDAEKYL